MALLTMRIVTKQLHAGIKKNKLTSKPVTRIQKKTLRQQEDETLTGTLREPDLIRMTRDLCFGDMLIRKKKKKG